MNRFTSLMTLSVFALTLAIGLPVMADEHKDQQDGDHDGKKQMMMDGKMPKKHQEHMKKFWEKMGHEDRDWRDWRGLRHWKHHGRKFHRWKDARKKWGERDDWKERDWEMDRDDRWGDDDGRHGDRDEYREDGDREKHSIHHLYKKAKYRLDLSDEQKQALSNLYFEAKLTLIDRRAEKKKRYLELKQLKHSEDPSRGEVMGKIDELYDARADVKQAKVGFMMDMKDQLGSEKWKKLTEIDHARDYKHGDRGYHDDGKKDEGEKASD